MNERERMDRERLSPTPRADMLHRLCPIRMAAPGALAEAGCLYGECEWYLDGYGCAVVALAREFLARRSE